MQATTENRLITNALVLGGILLSLGLIAVSAALNFRMAYRMGGTELDGWVYGSGAAIADGLKALLPFFVWWAWRKREWLAVGAGVVLFVVFTAYSFTAGMGYVAKLRAFSEGVRASAVETRAGLRDEESRIEARLEKLGVQRGEEEISAELEAVFARVLGKTTVGAYSENCTLARNWSRHSCARAAELRQELARAMSPIRSWWRWKAWRKNLVCTRIETVCGWRCWFWWAYCLSWEADLGFMYLRCLGVAKGVRV